MIIKIIGLIIGVLVLGMGIFYLVKEKDDKESRKIYTIVSIVGAVIAAVSALTLFICKSHPRRKLRGCDLHITKTGLY